MGCCCCCGGGGPSLIDTLKERPKVDAALSCYRSACDSAVPDKPSIIFRIFCFPCICCPCCPCGGGSEDTVVDPADVAGSGSDAGFLAEPGMVGVFTKVLSASSKGRVKTEHVGAALALVSVGSVESKCAALFEVFSGAAGITRDTVRRMIASIVHAGERMARRIADAVSAVASGGAFPGGKVVGMALATMGIVAFPAIIAAGTRKVIKAMDKDNDGKIEWDEFRRAALSRGSLIRKFISWFDRRLTSLSGGSGSASEPPPMEGYLEVDGERKYCFLDVVPPQERITIFNSKEEKDAEGFHVAECSLLEPCVLRVPEDGKGDQLAFEIVDKDKKVWKFRASSESEAFDWTDAVEDYCEAEDDEPLEIEAADGEAKPKKKFGCL